MVAQSSVVIVVLAVGEVLAAVALAVGVVAVAVAAQAADCSIGRNKLPKLQHWHQPLAYL